jgi:hypothetical protein
MRLYGPVYVSPAAVEARLRAWLYKSRWPAGQ